MSSEEIPHKNRTKIRTKNVPPKDQAGDQVAVQPRLRLAADRAGRWRRRPQLASLPAGERHVRLT